MFVGARGFSLAFSGWLWLAREDYIASDLYIGRGFGAKNVWA
jgi:hypothetical protein